MLLELSLLYKAKAILMLILYYTLSMIRKTVLFPTIHLVSSQKEVLRANLQLKKIQAAGCGLGLEEKLYWQLQSLKEATPLIIPS